MKEINKKNGGREVRMRQSKNTFGVIELGNTMKQKVPSAVSATGSMMKQKVPSAPSATRKKKKRKGII